MLQSPLPLYHLGFFIFLITLSLLFFYQAWENIIKKTISKYSFDALILFLSNKFANPTNRANTQRVSKDRTRLFLLGMFCLLVSIKGFIESYSWMMKYLVK